MSERIAVYDRSGNYVVDPARATDRAYGLNWDTAAPGGYGACAFTVARDVAAQWAVKQAYDLRVYDGNRIVYQGRLGDLVRALRSDGEEIRCEAMGYGVILSERRIRKRWYDNSPLHIMALPASRQTTDSEQNLDITTGGNWIIMRGGYGDATHVANDGHFERYIMPTGVKIKRFEGDVVFRSGEGISAQIYNDDQSTVEKTVTENTGVKTTTNLDTNMAAGDTESLVLILKLDATDIYDENDYVRVYNMLVQAKYHASHSAYGSEAYSNGEIVEDVLLLARDSDLSVDVDGITDPGLTTTPFATRMDNYETAKSLVERLAAYGDGSQNTYVWFVWDATGTSDDLPKFELSAYSTSDYEYQVSLAELDVFEETEDDSQVENWIIVEYTDDNDLLQFLTPDDDATLTDSTSVSDYGERHSAPVDIGKADSTRAQYIGQRYLAYHKDPLRRTTMAITGTIRDKQGVPIPANQVRAGDRVKVQDFNRVYYLRSTEYDADRGTLRMSSQPPDTIGVLMAQQELGVFDR